MELDSPSTNTLKKCCSCSCSCSIGKWQRFMKRKLEEIEEPPSYGGDDQNFFSVARVEMENECMALRETITSQQQSIQELYVELEEERNASCSAANEAMSMILRLQREKAEIQMEARQFKRFAEEKMAHDQQELLAIEELIYKKEQVIESLSCEIQAYKHRLMSLGLHQLDFDDALSNEVSFTSHHNRSRSMGGKSENAEWQDSEEFNRYTYSGDTLLGRAEKPNAFEYPPLRCSSKEVQEFPECEDSLDIEKYASGETPREGRELQNLEYRICELERTRSHCLDGKFTSGGTNVPDKTNSSQTSKYPKTLSTDSAYPGLVREAGHECTVESVSTPGPHANSKKVQFSIIEDRRYCGKEDNEFGLADGTGDRIYTIDSVLGSHGSKRMFVDENGGTLGEPLRQKSKVESMTCYTADGSVETLQPDDGAFDSKSQCDKPHEYLATPRGSSNRIDVADGDVVEKLNFRLQALEADRESLKQTIISMQTDKAQLILLREIAQQLCKELTPEKWIVKKPSLKRGFSFISTLKWIVSFIFHRKKSQRVKYPFGYSGNNVGLLLLLDKSPQIRQWRCVTRTKA
ncbi:Myosin-binding protein 7 [Nymphaea thermarum]|nr:Myosin-binding protein 7 [Nymphaea thermarum]